MIKLFLILGFTIYYTNFLDSLLETPLIGKRLYFATFYLAILIFCFILQLISKKETSKWKIKKGDTSQLIFAFIIVVMYVLWMLLPRSEFKEAYNVASFIIIAYLTFYLSKKNNILLPIFIIIFGAGTLFLLIQFINVGLPLYSFIDLKSIFFTQNIYRIRYNFNFYQPNACGNFVYVLLVLSGFLFYSNSHSKIKGKIFRIVILILCDVFLVNILLLTNSRNSIAGVLIYILCIAFYFIVDSKHINSKVKFLLKGLILICGVVLIMLNFNLVSYLFVNSRRSENFTRNLPLLNSTAKILFGLGIFPPGAFGDGSIGATAFYVDNYYLYVILELGLIGAIIVFSILARIGYKLHKNIKSTDHNKMFELGYSFFIAQIVTGFGETCVIYPQFFSSFLFLLICFICYDKHNTTVLVKESNA